MTPYDIGQTVKNERRAQGLRQDQLAAVAGVGVRFLVDLERGKPTAQIGKTLDVLAALGCRFTIDTPPAAPRPDP